MPLQRERICDFSRIIRLLALLENKKSPQAASDALCCVVQKSFPSPKPQSAMNLIQRISFLSTLDGVKTEIRLLLSYHGD